MPCFLSQYYKLLLFPWHTRYDREREGDGPDSSVWKELAVDDHFPGPRFLIYSEDNTVNPEDNKPRIIDL